MLRKEEEQLEYGFHLVDIDDESITEENKEENKGKGNVSLYRVIRNEISHRNVELLYMDDWALIKMFMEKDENSLTANVDFIL